MTLTTSTNVVPPSAVAPKDGKVLELDVALLDENPFQPRKEIDPVELKGLADSILAHGQIQPILAKPSMDGRFIVVAGHRRLAAFKLLLESAPEARRPRFSKIAAVLRLDVADRELAALAYIENTERADLSLVDQALALERMVKDGHAKTNEELAALTNQEITRIKRLRRIGRAPKWLRDAVENGVVLVTHTTPDGSEVRERRTLDLMLALQILSLYEHLQVASPKQAETRSTATMKRALLRGWSLRKLEAHVRDAIEGRVSIEESADESATLPPVFTATSKRFTIDLGRLGSATAAQRDELAAALRVLLASDVEANEGTVHQ